MFADIGVEGESRHDPMSAITPEADIGERRCRVRFVPKADILRCSRKNPRQYVFNLHKGAKSGDRFAHD